MSFVQVHHIQNNNHNNVFGGYQNIIFSAAVIPHNPPLQVNNIQPAAGGGQRLLRIERKESNKTMILFKFII
ncbi:unnamed protein product [Rotaria magnacalcarata]|uniref:Uncharacterized protein n=1 Tax=Rotaria magnacalcarata TaxID=392030 RepID=A0A819WMU8_9BILA|nr:unnamed protein product [Rotaria magnacalcarata]